MADQNKYTLPIGVDAREFFSGIASIDKGIDDLSKGVTDANKGMQAAFNGTAAASDKLNTAITGNAAQAEKFGKSMTDGVQSATTTLDALSIKLRRLQADLIGNQNILERKEINKQIQATKVAIDLETESLKKNAVAQKTIRAELTATRNEMAKLTLTGKGQTEQYAALRTRALDLAKVQKTVGDETKTAGEKTGGALTKSFGLLRQIALFVPGIGIAGIFNLAFEAIIKLVAQMDLFKKKSQEVNDAMKQGEKDSIAQSVSLDTLYRATQNTTLSIEQRNRAVAELQKQFPAYFANIDAETIKNGGAAKSYDALKEAILATARAKAIEGKITQVITEGLDEETRLRENLAEAQKKATDEAGRTLTVTAKDEEGALVRRELSLKESERFRQGQVALAAQVLKNFKDNQDKTTKALSESLDKQEAVVLSHPPIGGDPKKVKSDGDKIFNETQAQRKRIADLNKQYDSLQAKVVDDSLERVNAELEARKKATEELLNIEEGKIRHKEETGKKLSDLDNQELAAIAKIRTQLDKNLTLDKQKALDDFLLKQATLIVKANIEIAEAFGNLEELELEKLREGYKLKLLEYSKQYRSLPGKLKELQEAAIAAQARQEAAIRAKFAREAIDQEEKLQIASLNIAFGFKELPARVEEQKQAAILKVAIAAAKRRLEVELQTGIALNEVGIAQAREAVKALEAELAKLSGTKKFDNIFDVLGLTGEGGLTPTQIKAIQDGVNAIMQAYAEVTNAMLQANQTQIDLSSKRIDSFQTEIDALQSNFDKEEELRSRGLANNSQYYADQIALQKKAKDDEIKNRQELFEKQKAIQKAQLIADTIAQASSLVTASANVLEGFSTIPIVGVPLGILAVGAMIAGFVVAKANAFNAINNQQQSFGEGGTIDGESHSRGGRKYRALDGSGVVELEGGEEVTRKTQAQKYRQLLKAINDDSISSMSDESLAALLAGTGVTFKTDIPEQAERAASDFESAKSAVFIASNGKQDNSDMKAIREDVGYLADRKRNEIETWEDDRFTYERQGNTTTKIKKNG